MSDTGLKEQPRQEATRAAPKPGGELPATMAPPSPARDLADMLRTAPEYVSTHRAPNQETGNFSGQMEIVQSTSAPSSPETPPVKPDFDIRIASIKATGKREQSAAISAAAQESHTRLQDLAAGAYDRKRSQRAEGQGLKVRAKNAVIATADTAVNIKRAAVEAIKHPIKTGAKAYERLIVKGAIEDRTQHMVLELHATLDMAGAPLSKPFRDMLDAYSLAHTPNQIPEGFWGWAQDKRHKAATILKGQNLAVKQYQIDYARDLRIAAMTPPGKNTRIDAFRNEPRNKPMLEAYQREQSGLFAQQQALLERSAIQEALGDVDTGKQLGADNKKILASEGIIPTAEALLLQCKTKDIQNPDGTIRRVLDVPPAIKQQMQLETQYRYLDAIAKMAPGSEKDQLTKNMAMATNLYDIAERAANKAIEATPHATGAATIDAVKGFFADGFNASVTEVTDEQLAELKTRSKTTEKAITAYLSSGGVGEYLTAEDPAVTARVNLLSKAKVGATGLGLTLAVAGAQRGANYAVRTVMVGAAPVVTAVIAATRAWSTRGKDFALARTAAARGENLGQQGGKTTEVASRPMIAISETEANISNALDKLTTDQKPTRIAIETALTAMANYDARRAASIQSGLPLWYGEKPNEVSAKLKIIDQKRLAITKKLGAIDSLADLKAIAADLEITPQGDSTDKAAYITAIRRTLASGLEDKLRTGRSLGEAAKNIVGKQDNQVTLRQARRAEIWSKTKTAAGRGLLAGAVSEGFMLGMIEGRNVLAPVVIEALNYVHTHDILPAPGTIRTPDLNLTNNETQLQGGPEGQIGGSEQAAVPIVEAPAAVPHEVTAAEIFDEHGIKVPEKDKHWFRGEAEWELLTNAFDSDGNGKADGIQFAQYGKKVSHMAFETGDGRTVFVKTEQIDTPRGPASVVNLSPKGDGNVTVLNEDGSTDEIPQANLAHLIMDKQALEARLAKIKPGTSLGLDYNRAGQNILTLATKEQGGDTEYGFVHSVDINAKGEKTYVATVDAKGELRDKVTVEPGKAGATETVPLAGAPDMSKPLQPIIGSPIPIEYPGGGKFEHGAALDSKGDIVIPKNVVDTVTQLSTKFNPAGTYSLQYTEHGWNVVDANHITRIQNLHAEGGKLHYILTNAKVEGDNIVFAPVSEKPPIQIPHIDTTTAHPVDTGTVVDAYDTKIDHQEWVHDYKAEHGLHQYLTENGKTLRIQQNGEATHIAYDVFIDGKRHPMLIAAQHDELPNGQKISFIEIPMEQGSSAPDTLAFANGAPPMKSEEFSHMFIDPEDYKTYLKTFERDGKLPFDKDGTLDIDTDQHKDGPGIFRGGKEGLVSAVNYEEKNINGKTETTVTYISSSKAHADIPDTIEVSGKFPIPFEKTKTGFTLAGQKFDWPGFDGTEDKDGNLVVGNPPTPILNYDQQLFLLSLPPTKEGFVFRIDKRSPLSFDMIDAKTGVVSIENISIDSTGSLHYTPASFVEVVVNPDNTIDHVSITAQPTEGAVDIPATAPVDPDAGNHNQQAGGARDSDTATGANEYKQEYTIGAVNGNGGNKIHFNQETHQINGDIVTKDNNSILVTKDQLDKLGKLPDEYNIEYFDTDRQVFVGNNLVGNLQFDTSGNPFLTGPSIETFAFQNGEWVIKLRDNAVQQVPHNESLLKDVEDAGWQALGATGIILAGAALYYSGRTVVRRSRRRPRITSPTGPHVPVIGRTTGTP